jgi:uncharacterized SAM-binding protein YcdF (DUF218 family)
MDKREEFVALLESQKLVRGSVIFVLQGDGVDRAAHVAKLFREGFAPEVAMVGSANDRAYRSFPSREVRDEILQLGVTQSALHFEEVGSNTREEAERAMELAKEKGWKTILIVTSPHHQYRTFLTFLKAMRDANLDLALVNAVAPLPWDEPTPWGTRRSFLPQEFDRIHRYQEKGHVASYKEGVAYLKGQK